MTPAAPPWAVGVGDERATESRPPAQLATAHAPSAHHGRPHRGGVLRAAGSIGSPLLGLSVFAATDELSTNSPYFDAGVAGTVVQNTFEDDTYTAEIPVAMLYAQSVRDGEPACVEPVHRGGTPLGANAQLRTAVSAEPAVLRPAGWLAPAY